MIGKIGKDVYKNIAIIFLFIILICFIVRLFSIIWSNFTVIQSEYDKFKNDYEIMHENFINKNKYESREIELIHEKNKLNVLNSINQEEIIKIIHHHALNLGIIINNYNFSEIFPVTHDDEIIDDMYMINVNIEFYSSYENLLLFIGALQNDKINMSITNLHSAISEEDYNLVKMDMKFYALTFTN